MPRVEEAYDLKTRTEMFLFYSLAAAFFILSFRTAPLFDGYVTGGLIVATGLCVAYAGLLYYQDRNKS